NSNIKKRAGRKKEKYTPSYTWKFSANRSCSVLGNSKPAGGITLLSTPGSYNDFNNDYEYVTGWNFMGAYWDYNLSCVFRFFTRNNCGSCFRFNRWFIQKSRKLN